MRLWPVVVVATLLCLAAVLGAHVDSWSGRPALIGVTALLALALAVLVFKLERQTRRLHKSVAAAYQNEQRFRSLFDEALHLAATLSPAGVVNSANHALCAAFGRSAEELVGRPFAEAPWWSGDSVLGPRLAEAIALASKGGQASFECNLPRQAGGSMNVEFSVKPMTDARGRVVELLVEGRDLTARKRTEDLLEARLRLAAFSSGHSLHDLLVATLDEVCGLTDSQTGFYHFLLEDQTTLALQAWSTRTTREYCHVEGELRHYDVHEAGVWADAVRQRRSIVYNDYGALSHRQGLPQGHAVVTRFMSVPIIRDGRIMAIIGVGNKPTDFNADDLMVVETLADLAWDLAERKRAEEAVVEKAKLIQRRYESLRALNTIAGLPPESLGRQLADALALGARHLGLPMGIIARVDAADYTVLYHHAPPGVDLADGQMFPLGDTYCAITLAADDVVAIPHMGQSKHAGHPCYEAFGLESYLGVPLWVGGRRFGTVNFSSPEPFGRDFDEGELEFVRLLARWVGSVLERAGAEAEIVAAKEAAEQRSQELASSNNELEQFAYAASHDLRQPLRMVTSYLGLIERRYADRLDADGLEFLAFARDGALHMDDLICDLLEYSRVGRHGQAPEPVDLTEVAEEAHHHLLVLVEETGAELAITTEPATVRGNRSELMRLFQNLIGNGIKYRSPDRPPRVQVRWSREGANWQVEVEDNGIGIAPEYREDVFKIFRRLHTSAEYEGTGIGLAVCQKIVKNHGGRIWVDSRQGEGSVFRFTLPVT
jgi:PAS domain S-box-containing protein